jgi:hypothetical protein
MILGGNTKFYVVGLGELMLMSMPYD